MTTDEWIDEELRKIEFRMRIYLFARVVENLFNLRRRR